MNDPADLKIKAQVALIRRMREVRASLPRWWSGERQMEAIAMDPECQRLKAEADRLWSAA
jgi:hypothetical protein